MFKTTRLLATVIATALAIGPTVAETYEITVTSLLDEELLAPFVVTGVHNDPVIFSGDYVTAAGESQVLTGNTAFIVEAIGDDPVVVGRGIDGEPGYLIGPGSSVTVSLETEATALRIMAMVAPTLQEDTYVTGVVDVNAGDTRTIELDRYDIGYDEKRRTREWTGTSAARVEIVRR
ncbi:MAG: hypothetical protein AAGK37_20115 [Pseudomonadota bacterium]